MRVLAESDLIAAEDTRHSKKLLQRFKVTTRTIAFHEHNESKKMPQLLRLLHAGKCIALVSDAGTPLVSDPGFKLVRAAHAQGIRVIPVPGPCAAVAALSAAGLPTDRFVFEGFPPARAGARTAFFQQRQYETATLVYYEAPHRLRASLNAMASMFGSARPAAIARELTKKFEIIVSASLRDLCEKVAIDRETYSRGEYVILIEGIRDSATEKFTVDSEYILRILLHELSTKQAAALTAAITKGKRRDLYSLALRLQQD